MESLRRQTVAFTGHRRYDHSFDDALRESIAALYANGYRIFLSGMAIGFDMAAAEAVLEFGEQHSDVELHCIIPFEGQELRFGKEQQAELNVRLCFLQHGCGNLHFLTSVIGGKCKEKTL